MAVELREDFRYARNKRIKGSTVGLGERALGVVAHSVQYVVDSEWK
ncbi:hypothetical protein [Advenella sp. FME57]|nr:hypothetical protein [Advenella sp. FME57]